MTASGVRRRLGRRGVPLALLGVGQMAWGSGYFAAPATDHTGQEALRALLPIEAWAWVWITAGTIALASAFLPEGRDRWGFVAAVMPPLAWALGYGWAALATSNARAGFVFLWYLLSHALLILWAASVAEYVMPRRKRRSRRAPPLFLLGTGQICWGIGFVAAPHSTEGDLNVLLGIMPMPGWAAVWITTGAVTLVCSLRPMGRDRWGFVGAVALPAVWAAAYGWEWATGSYPRGGFICIWYLTAHAGMALWAASVPEWEMPRFPQNNEGRT